MRNLYAIMHIPTGKFLPEPKGYAGRGGSFTEPENCNDDYENPRLFKTERSAKAALTQWLRGHHEGIHEKDWDEWSGMSYSYCVGATVKPQPHRMRHLMKIVPFKLIIDTQKLQEMNHADSNTSSSN